MKRLKLNSLNPEKTEVLTRQQLKQVFGGTGSDGGSPVATCTCPGYADSGCPEGTTSCSVSADGKKITCGSKTSDCPAPPTAS